MGEYNFVWQYFAYPGLATLNRMSWKNSPDVSVYHDSVSPRRTQSSLLLYINKMMCERRDRTYFSERDAKHTTSQARDPIGQRAI